MSQRSQRSIPSPWDGSGIDFANLLELVSEIVILVGEDGVVHYLNSPAEAILGYPVGEVIGSALGDLIHPDDLAPLWQGVDRSSGGDDAPTLRVLVRARASNGDWIELEARSCPLESAGGGGFIVIARDRSELRRVEEQLHQAQKMEAVGLLASGIAHDFNNLLTGIRGYADLLLRELPQTDPRRVDVEEIRKAAHRAAALTRQLLTFSRRQDLEPQILDPAEVIIDLEKMLQRLIDQDIELRIVGRDVGRIAADRGQLEQVLINLAINAQDAMPDGGLLEIGVDELTLDEETAPSYSPLEAGEYIQIRVSDTGSGIDAETRSQIFEPLFTTKEPGKGTGLGLSTVQSLAQRNGGIVSVETTPGIGSTFQVILPSVEIEGAIELDDDLPEVARGEDGYQGMERVLLVEDEEVVRRFTARVLRRKGYRVLTASDGQEALALAREFPGKIDLLITDIIMPHLGGMSLAAQLLKFRPEVRVLLISGHPRAAYEVSDLEGGGAALLKKPFTPEALAKRVRELLDQNSQ